MKKKLLINFSVSTGEYQSYIDNITVLARHRISSAIYFANVHMFIEAHKNKDFLTQVNNADIVTPDGQPLAWLLRLLYGIKQCRVAGMDVLPDLLDRMEKENLPVYFYGGTPEMISKTNAYVKDKYPGLQVAGLYSPPFRALTEKEEKEIVEKINHASPAIVFVFIGCPQQEKWIASNKGKIHAVMTGIGGALPVTIGMQQRAPVWMRNFGLEWLFRFLKEPRRLFKRYLVTNSLFIFISLKALIRLKVLVPLKLSTEKIKIAQK